MKMKEFGPPGSVPGAPLDPPLVLFPFNSYVENFMLHIYIYILCRQLKYGRVFVVFFLQEPFVVTSDQAAIKVSYCIKFDRPKR